MIDPYPYTAEDVTASADAIRKILNVDPGEKLAKKGVILGSGQGKFVNRLKEDWDVTDIPYVDIKGFPTASVSGHNGVLSYAKKGDRFVLVMQGRFHCYEGYHPAWVGYPTRVMRELGVQDFILTNASGGISNELNVGDLMLVKDHINNTGKTPLLGPNDERFGPRFLDMTTCYPKSYRDEARRIANDLEIRLKEGVYMGVLGPCYETPSEIRMFRHWGGDCVGMSTIFESITAHHGGGRVLCIACITNKAAGMTENKLHHQEVKDNAMAHVDKLSALLMELI